MWDGEGNGETYDPDEEERSLEASWEAAEEAHESQLRERLMPELYSDFVHDVLSGNNEDLYNEVIDRFAGERLKSFYLAHPAVAEDALFALEEARDLKSHHPAAALVFASIAIEVGLKAAVLKPILHGLVNIDAAAVLVAGLVPRQHSREFRKVLLGILNEVGGVDLLTFKREGSSQTIWQEIERSRDQRHRVVHSAVRATPAEAEHAISVASVVLEHVFPRVLNALGLKTGERLRVLER